MWLQLKIGLKFIGMTYIIYIDNMNIDQYGREDKMLASRTPEQKTSQDAYMEKMQDIKVRVPKEYYDKIKLCAENKGTSINKLVISLLEGEIGEKILSIRERNKLEKESENEIN
jgi:hypothetical protein